MPAEHEPGQRQRRPSQGGGGRTTNQQERARAYEDALNTKAAAEQTLGRAQADADRLAKQVVILTKSGTIKADLDLLIKTRVDLDVAVKGLVKVRADLRRAEQTIAELS